MMMSYVKVTINDAHGRILNEKSNLELEKTLVTDFLTKRNSIGRILN